MSHQQPESGSATLRSEVRLVFALVLSVFFLLSSGVDTSEGRYHYMIAHQIWSEGSLSFAEARKGIFTVAPNGRTYASHEIGNTLFMLPVAGLNIVLEKALAHRQGGRKLEYATGFLVTLMPAIYCALTAALLYVLLRLFFLKSITAALCGSLAFAFCSFVSNYSRIAFDGVLCMTLLAGAMLSMMQFRRTMDTRLFLLATTLLGFGVITRLTMVLALVAFGAYLTTVFWRDRTRLIRLALIAAVALTPFAAWQTYYNHLRTGLWLVAPVTSAQYAANNSLTGDLAVGLVGQLFSPGKSIFVYVPLALVSVVCFRRFTAWYPSEAVFVAVLSGLWLLLHAKLANWFGAWGWGLRYFVTITPVLVLPACVAWEWMMENVWRRRLLLCALTWGAVLSVASIIGNWSYRMRLANSLGGDQATDYELNWSPAKGQAVDMIVSSASNVRNLFLGVSGPNLPEHSAVSDYASTTINVWINSAAYMGVPRVLLAGAGFGLIAVAGYSLFALRSINLRTLRVERHDAA